MASKTDYGQVQDLLHGVLGGGGDYVGYQYEGSLPSPPRPVAVAAQAPVVYQDNGMNFVLEK
jgi:hypothetical protein